MAQQFRKSGSVVDAMGTPAGRTLGLMERSQLGFDQKQSFAQPQPKNTSSRSASSRSASASAAAASTSASMASAFYPPGLLSRPTKLSTGPKRATVAQLQKEEEKRVEMPPMPYMSQNSLRKMPSPLRQPYSAAGGATYGSSSATNSGRQRAREIVEPTTTSKLEHSHRGERMHTLLNRQHYQVRGGGSDVSLDPSVAPRQLDEEHSQYRAFAPTTNRRLSDSRTFYRFSADDISKDVPRQENLKKFAPSQKLYPPSPRRDLEIGMPLNQNPQ